MPPKKESPINSKEQGGGEGSAEKERPEFERLRKIVFWSFYASQGDPGVQKTVLSNVVRMHPDLIPSMEEWVKKFSFSPPGKDSEEKDWTIDKDLLLSEPSGARLLRDVSRFVVGHLHPEGSVPEADTSEFDEDIRKETARRVADLFSTALPAMLENKKPVFESIEACADALLYRDSSLMMFYREMKKQAKDSSFSKEQRATARRRIAMRKEVGVSLVFKYALSEKRATAVPRLAPEVQAVFEAVGEHIRSHTRPWGRNKRVYASRPAEYIIVADEWKKATKENVEL